MRGHAGLGLQGELHSSCSWLIFFTKKLKRFPLFFSNSSIQSHSFCPHQPQDLHVFPSGAAVCKSQSGVGAEKLPSSPSAAGLVLLLLQQTNTFPHNRLTTSWCEESPPTKECGRQCKQNKERWGGRSWVQTAASGCAQNFVVDVSESFFWRIGRHLSRLQ